MGAVRTTAYMAGRVEPIEAAPAGGFVPVTVREQPHTEGVRPGSGMRSYAVGGSKEQATR